MKVEITIEGYHTAIRWQEKESNKKEDKFREIYKKVEEKQLEINW